MCSRLHAEYEKLLASEKPWQERIAKRLNFWPELEFKDNYFVAKEGTFTIPGMADPGSGPNFWVLSKQYYALAWTVFTLAYSELGDLPYKANLASDADSKHRAELQGLISSVGFGRESTLELAHLSCETALKAMLIHTLPDMGKPASFPKTHDLEKLVIELGDENAQILTKQFEEWPERVEALSLEKIVTGSAERFIQQRYGESFDAPIQYGVMALSKFIHSSFLEDGT